MVDAHLAGCPNIFLHQIDVGLGCRVTARCAWLGCRVYAKLRAELVRQPPRCLGLGLAKATPQFGMALDCLDETVQCSPGFRQHDFFYPSTQISTVEGSDDAR